MNIYDLEGNLLERDELDPELGRISIGDIIEENGEKVRCEYWVPYDNDRLIDRYKARLRETDYVVAKIAEGVATKEEYAEVLANRKLWREKINEL